MVSLIHVNIFDYKADVIHEGDEMDEEEELSHVFSFDINSDGIEESNDDDMDVAISMDDDFDAFEESTKKSSETSASYEDELVNTIVRALSDEKNKDMHQRNTTESMLNQATQILTANLYDDDNDAVDSAIYDPQDEESIERRYDKKQFFAE
eukprot:638795_1